MKDHKQIWENCLTHIKSEIDQESYQTWFKPIVSVKYDQQTLTIAVPNWVFYEWIEGHYVNLLRKIIHKEIGIKGKLAYQIVKGKKKNISKSTKTNKPTKSTNTKSEFLANQMHLNPKFTFDNFIVGDSNQLAQAAMLSVANNLGKTSFNPLLVHSNGKVGMGKTHLAQALIQHVKLTDPNRRIMYITAEKFTAQFIQKIRENKTQTFIDYYGSLDIIVIDDIQFLSNKEKTQEIFFHIFNQLHQKGKQIVMTSDVSPNKLQGFEKRLWSRFKWGFTVDIKKPNLETRIAIIHIKLKQHNSHLSDNIINIIATKSTTNIRELEGVLISILACADLTKQAITEKMVLQVIDNVVTPSKPEKELTTQYLQKTVADYFSIPLQTIKKKSRKKEIVIPRQVIMYLLRKHTNQSLKAIGTIFGKKDHSTVSYGCTAVQNLMQINKHFRSQIEAIEKNIRQDFPQLV